jgi:hypothetical protein
MEWVRDMADYYQIADRIDWDKVRPILKARSGIAQDITKAAAPVTATPLPAPAAPATPAAPKEVRLSPLQGKAAKLE